MKRFVWPTLIILGAAFFGYTYLEKEARKEARQTAERQATSEITQRYAGFIEKHGATDRWEYALTNGESYRFEPILTIELEKVWFGARNPLPSLERLAIS